jgi:hypothetical protein
LTVAIERLAAAESSRDEDSIWEETTGVLDRLYACEEAEKRVDPGGIAAYYAHRDESPAGRALGGLIWVRGLVVHHQAEVRELLWKATEAWLRIGGRWVPAAKSIYAGGGWQEVSTNSAVAAWPSRSQLPKSDRSSRGRDELYRQHVEGQHLLLPVRAARDYLENER